MSELVLGGNSESDIVLGNGRGLRDTISTSNYVPYSLNITQQELEEMLRGVNEPIPNSDGTYTYLISLASKVQKDEMVLFPKKNLIK